MNDRRRDLAPINATPARWTTGWALSVRPTQSSAPPAGADDVLVESWPVGVGPDELPVYVARPKGAGVFPAVLVFQEIFGIHAYVQEVCRRLAREGYVAAAPDFYFRLGDATRVLDIPTLRATLVEKTPQSQVWADADATVRRLESSSCVDPTRLAVTGFCWGGNLTWTYASHNPRVRAGVAWYGKLAETAGPPPKRTPLELASSLTVPILGLYGGKDASIPAADVDAMRAILANGRSGSRIDVYPDADHGFHADYRPSFHREAAEDGWRKMLGWFREHGVGSR
jgi:carboxymethylenebutenolidase